MELLGRHEQINVKFILPAYKADQELTTVQRFLVSVCNTTENIAAKYKILTSNFRHIHKHEK